MSVIVTFDEWWRNWRNDMLRDGDRMLEAVVAMERLRRALRYRQIKEDRVMAYHGHLKQALAGPRVDMALRILVEGGCFLTRLETVPVKSGGWVGPRDVVVYELLDAKGTTVVGASKGTFRTFRRCSFLASASKSGEFPRTWFITERGKGFADARREENKYGIWGHRPVRKCSIKAFVEQRLADGQLDLLALAREVAEAYPFKCGGYGYVYSIKRNWDRAQAA